MPAWLSNVLRLVIVVLMPLVLVLTNVRILLTPLYINWEYNLSDFPADLYGFTRADRLKYSAIALDYLVNEAGIDFLGNQKFPDGQEAPPESRADFIAPRDATFMYNDRELKHMADVKVVVKGALTVWMGASLLWLIAVVVLALQPDTRDYLRTGLIYGALFTGVVLVALALYIAFGFDTFFVQFHEVFFNANSWRFLWSDTLIRLFPEKFWYDVFLWIAGGAIVEAILLAGVAWFGIKPK